MWAAGTLSARSAKRSGLPGLAPGPTFPNWMMSTGWCPASAASAASSR
jgi:hypothetical protein